ncbi:MAG TPA: hypothetical protein VF032_17255, partial [Thermoleophilaceae bacterium]
IVMHPLPPGLATMPQPCSGVPANPWCRPPHLSKVSMKPRRWRLGSALPHLARKRARRRGTAIRFTVSVPATVRLTFKRAHHRAQTLLIKARRGANVLRFSGRLSRHRRLHAGHYTLRIRAVDAVGSASAPRRIRFTALRR